MQWLWLASVVTARQALPRCVTRVTAGKQAEPGSVERDARGWSAFAVKASRRRDITAVSRHTRIKWKGLAVSWLTHCRNRLSRSWTIRSRS
jgi:hypothetical protein